MAAWDSDPVVTPKKSPWDSDPVVGKAPAWHADPIASTPHEAKQGHWYDNILKPAPEGSINPLTNFAGEESEAVGRIKKGDEEIKSPTVMGRAKGAWDVMAGTAQAWPPIAGYNALAKSGGNIYQGVADYISPGQKLFKSEDFQAALPGAAVKGGAAKGLFSREMPHPPMNTVPDEAIVGEDGVHPVTGQPMPLTHGEQFQRLNDSFQELKTNRAADHSYLQGRATQYLKDHPTLDDPITKMDHPEGQAIISGNMEGDPQAVAKMTPQLRKIQNEYIMPLHKEAEENHKWFRAHNGLDPEEKSAGAYMRRKLEGVEHPVLDSDIINTPLPTKLELKKMLPQRWQGRKASTLPSSEKARSFFVAQNEKTGTRRLITKDGSDELLHPDEKMVPAYTREIEEQTPFRYSKNALADMIDVVAEQRVKKRLIEHTERIQASGGFKANSMLTDPKKLDQTRLTEPLKIKLAAEQGWTTTKHPQYPGMIMHPRLAELLDDASGAHTFSEKVAAGNRLSLSLLFWSPYVHIFNVGYHNFVSRGMGNFTIPGHARAWRALGESLHDVGTQSPKFRQVLREGGPLLSASLDNRPLHEQIVKALASSKDPIYKKLIGKLNILKQSNKTLWWAGDVLMMQRIREEEALGKTTKQAIREVRKHMPDYRVPPRVLGSRWVSQTMQDPALGQFNRFHYNVFASLGHMKALFRPDSVTPLKDQIDAFGHVTALLMLGAVIQPAINEVVRKLSSQRHSYVNNFGPLGPPGALGMIPGEEQKGSMHNFLVHAFAFGPLVDSAIALYQNADPFTHQTIMTQSGKKSDTWSQTGVRQAGQLIEKMAQINVSPYEAVAQGWRDMHSDHWLPQSMAEALKFGGPLIAQGFGVHLKSKPPYDSVSSKWHKTGEAGETQYRTTRRGARGPVEYYLNKASKVLAVHPVHKRDPSLGGPQ